MSAKHWLVSSSLLLVLLTAVACGQSPDADAMDAGKDSPSSRGGFLCEGYPVPFCKATCGVDENAGEGACATGTVCCYGHPDAGVPRIDDAGDAADALAE